MPKLTKITGDIGTAMSKWEPIRFSQTKVCNNDEIWEVFEKNGLKTKYFKKDKLVSEKKNKEALEDNALMLEDIADPFRTLKNKLDIRG